MARPTTKPVGLVGQVPRSRNAPASSASAPRVAANRPASANEPTPAEPADVAAV